MTNLEIALQYTETIQKQRTIVVSKEELQHHMGCDAGNIDWDNISGEEITYALEEMQERNLVLETEFSAQEIGGVTNIRVLGLGSDELPQRDLLDSKLLRRSVKRRKKRLFNRGHRLAIHFGKAILTDHSEAYNLSDEGFSELKYL